MYRNYIFDLYGTLIDIHTDEDNSAVWEKLSIFYGYYGAIYSPDKLKESYYRLVQELENGVDSGFAQSLPGGKTERIYRDSHEANPEIKMEEVFKRLYTEKGVNPQEELVVHTGQFFRVLTTEYVRLYDGVTKMLELLRNRGSRIYLLSNAQRIFTEYELHMLDIVKYFDGIMISSDYGVKKPDCRFFNLLLERYQIKPEESIMIGNDEQSDMVGAKNVGMDTCYIHSNISPEYKRKVDVTYIQMEMDWEMLCKRLGIF